MRLTKAPLGGGKKAARTLTDRAKRGVKRSLLTEAKGLPIGLATAGANRHDSQLVRATLKSVPIPRPQPRPKSRNICSWIKPMPATRCRRCVKEFGYTAHVPLRGAQAQKIKRQTRHKSRRLGGRETHSWMNRFRAIHPLGEETRELFCTASSGLCFHHVPGGGPTEIGSNDFDASPVKSARFSEAPYPLNRAVSDLERDRDSFGSHPCCARQQLSVDGNGHNLDDGQREQQSTRR